MEIAHLPNIAKKIRRQIIQMVFEAGSGHLAGPLSATDLLVACYFGGILEKEDKFILSAGHYSPAFYSVLANLGSMSEKELETFEKIGSRLQGHPRYHSLPGIETSSGSLGQGLSQAAGMALALKMNSSTKRRIYCLMSDGEQQEGAVWETAMFAAKYKLDNLCAIIDKNNIQIDGETKNIMPLRDLGAKYLSFGWEVFEVDGHNFGKILEVMAVAKDVHRKPVVIIAKTIAGKGISFMEGKWEWHHGKLSENLFKKALAELK